MFGFSLFLSTYLLRSRSTTIIVVTIDGKEQNRKKTRRKKREVRSRPVSCFLVPFPHSAVTLDNVLLRSGTERAKNISKSMVSFFSSLSFFSPFFFSFALLSFYFTLFFFMLKISPAGPVIVITEEVEGGGNGGLGWWRR